MKGPLKAYHSVWIRYVLRWPSGITLGPIILFKWDRKYIWPRLFRHELQHYYQYRRYGLLKYFFYFLRSLPAHGWGDKHPMEKGAENHELEELNAEEQAWYKGPESKIAKAVDYGLTAVFAALVGLFAFSFYMWTQGK